jgi:hypothetical protein
MKTDVGVEVLVFNLGTIWKLVVSFTPWSLYARKVVPIHAMKTDVGVEVLVFNLGTIWKLVVSFTPWSLYDPEEGSLVFIE